MGAVSPQEDEVDVDIFRRWLEVGTMQLGRVVGRWWAEAPVESEAAPEALKECDAETAVDLYMRIRLDVAQESGAAEGSVTVRRLCAWLQQQVGEAVAEAGEKGICAAVEQVIFELGVLQAHHDVAAPTGGMQEGGAAGADPEQEAISLAESLVFGYPSRAADPTQPRQEGRFCKAFPLEYPMGVADMYAWRPKRVSQAEYVQHMLRLASGHVVQELRSQRLVWALVNSELLSEPRGKDTWCTDWL